MEDALVRRMMSPSPSPGAMRVNKRIPSHGKHYTSLSRGSSGRTTGLGFVREQYTSVRQRALRDLGAGVGEHAFDTSHAGFLDWIRSERITRLPHKGGSWDRVLIGAQYFAAQVNRLREIIDREIIESFTPDCAAASNLVFGQCLLLLEVRCSSFTS